MLKTFKYRISPTKEQEVLLNKHIGASRFIYNLALECKQMAWSSNRVNIKKFDLIKQLPELRREYSWLKEIGAQSLYTPIMNLDVAYDRFFKGKSNFPKYKKKSDYGNFNIPQGVKLKDGKLVIPKFKKGICLILHRPIQGVIRQATISKKSTGKYFVSILCETGEIAPNKSVIEESTSIGIDLGVKNFAITSDGEVSENPKFLYKAQSKLRYVQRKYSKHKGKRTKQRFNLLHEKIVNQRKDFLHKTSTKLIRENQTICLEDLAVSNMVKNHKLAQSINDASWSAFTTILEYKAEWRGVNILRIGRFEPSSKTCSCCGAINKELTLKDREWTCKSCGTLLNRDVNAAINIKSFALKNILSGTDRKNQGKLPTLVGALNLEIRNE